MLVVDALQRIRPVPARRQVDDFIAVDDAQVLPPVAVGKLNQLHIGNLLNL